MRARQQVSRTGLELIKRFEGYRQKAVMLPDGRWTIGYGHTRTARAGAEVSPADAEALLIYDLMEVTQTLAELVFAPLNQNQYDALAAFVFNVGREKFQASAVLKRINEGALLQAACAFDLWRKAQFEGEAIVIDALVRRRAAEKALFLTPPGGFVPAPSPLLRPEIDFDMSGTIPRQTPVDIVAATDGDRLTAERADHVPAPPAVDEAPEPGPADEAVSHPPLENEVAPPEPPAAAEYDSAPQPEPEPEPEQPSNVLTLTPPEERAEPAPESAPVASFPEAANESDPEPELFFPEGAVMAERSVFDIGGRTAMDSPFGEADEGFGEIDEAATRGGPNMLGYLVLAVVGLAVFAGGIVWGFNAGGANGSLLSQIVGWVLGLAGIACVAVAVYFLLDRLGGREEPESE